MLPMTYLCNKKPLKRPKGRKLKKKLNHKTPNGDVHIGLPYMCSVYVNIMRFMRIEIVFKLKCII